MSNSEVIKNLVASTNGKIFTVSFVKKDGNLRTLTGRTGVSKYTNGGVAGWKSNDDNIGVFEFCERQGKEAYRCFNANSVKSLKISGKVYNF